MPDPKLNINGMDLPELNKKQYDTSKPVNIEELIKNNKLELLSKALSDGVLTQEEIQEAGYSFKSGSEMNKYQSFSGELLERAVGDLQGPSIFNFINQDE